MWSRYQTLLLALAIFVRFSQAFDLQTLTLIKLKIDEPVEVDASVEHLVLERATGSVGPGTLSSLKDLQTLMFRDSDIKNIENGVLCSLPNLRRLYFAYNKHLPILTKEILSGCHNLTFLFIGGTPIEPSSLDDMTNVHELSLDKCIQGDFNREYLSHLEKLKIFSLTLPNLEHVEDGLLCSSSSIEKLYLRFEKSSELSQSIFAGCNELKNIYVLGYEGVTIADGQNPFGQLASLQKLQIISIRVGHLTKDFFNGLPNLDQLILVEGTIGQIDTDAFEGTPNLRELHISEIKLKESDLRALHSLQNLEKMSISGVGLGNINAIKGLAKLETLDLTGNEISRFDIAQLKTNLPALKQLDLTFNPLDPDFLTELMKEETLVVTVRDNHWNY